MSRFSFALTVALSGAFAACAVGAVDDGEQPVESDAASTAGVGGTTTTTSTASAVSVATASSSVSSSSSSGSGGSGPADCGPKESDIFLISKANDLYRFEPTSGTTTKVGPIMCQVVAGVTPFSMAVDRKEFAWILYSDGRLYKVSTLSAACEPSGLVPSQQNFKTYSMAFVSNTQGSSEETLTIANTSSLGTIDLAALKVSLVGGFGFSAPLQLTGNGKGELYGFFTSAPAYLSPIDKLSAAVGSHQKLDTIKTTGPSAFAQWGGSFWFFTSPLGVSSRVDRYDPISKQVETTSLGIGFEAIAAGVSTCAPTK
jgi:hypothetical protein